MIYHIVARKAWREALRRGEYRAGSLEPEGFIHCSTRSQVLPVANTFYAGQRGLLLLSIDPALLLADLRWEPPSGDAPPSGVPKGELFPHVYGPINLDAIVKASDLETRPDGRYTLSEID